MEGSHPYYQWFYNRQNINQYLGFERFRYLEGDYENLTWRYAEPCQPICWKARFIR